MEGRLFMSRTLTPRSTLETLKKEAKRWLKAIRAGEPQAVQRLAAAGVQATSPGLRDVQLALAREHGLPGWSALRQALEDLAMARRSHEERVDIVLRSPWGGDPIAAARILARWPDIGKDNLCTAVATGNLAEVERYLAANPAAASKPAGPLNWQPLLYLAYARLHDRDADAVAIARSLLDHGAAPNVGFDDGWGNTFTALTGVIGEGEGDRPPHPAAKTLASLLIERGADPFDKQALYNTSITRDDTTWLEILWSASERRGNVSHWQVVPDKAVIGGSVPLSALDYLLGNAVAYNHVKRAEWLLSHGADANGLHAYSKRPLREEALIYGYTAIANLLVAHGAATVPLTGHAAFQAACMALDMSAARALAERNPQYLQQASPMLVAARAGRADVVSLLLDLGMDVDVEDATRLRGLHNAAMSGALDVARLLIANGADVDRPTLQYGGPLGFAAHFRQREMAALLAPLSMDVANLTYLGMTDRLRELLATNPALANAVQPRSGITPLFALPDDEDDAADMAALLLDHGADPELRDRAGQSAEQVARKRGLMDAADLMARSTSQK
jgi:uncharacterized protein